MNCYRYMSIHVQCTYIQSYAFQPIPKVSHKYKYPIQSVSQKSIVSEYKYMYLHHHEVMVQEYKGMSKSWRCGGGMRLWVGGSNTLSSSRVFPFSQLTLQTPPPPSAPLPSTASVFRSQVTQVHSYQLRRKNAMQVDGREGLHLSF